jgi:hypothetical protein
MHTEKYDVDAKIAIEFTHMRVQMQKSGALVRIHAGKGAVLCHVWSKKVLLHMRLY